MSEREPPSEPPGDAGVKFELFPRDAGSQPIFVVIEPSSPEHVQWTSEPALDLFHIPGPSNPRGAWLRLRLFLESEGGRDHSAGARGVWLHPRCVPFSGGPPGLKSKRERIPVEGHRVVLDPEQRPHIEIIAAGRVLARCHFYGTEEEPKGTVVQDPQTGIIEVHHPLDTYDYVLRLLNNPRQSLWVSKELGLENLE